MINTVIFDLGGVLVDFHPEKGMREIGFSEDARTNLLSTIVEIGTYVAHS